MAMLRALAAAMAVAAAFFEVALCVNYHVGSPSGAWDLTTNYTQWVSGKTFHVGDTLTFTYPPTAHDVMEVDSTGFSACNAASATLRSATGNTKVTLTAAGKQYFICGIPTHCSQGMQLEIDVVRAIGETSPPSSSPPSPISDSAPPAQAPASSTPSSTPPTPPPPPPNAAVPGSITGREAMVTLGLGLATAMVALGL